MQIRLLDPRKFSRETSCNRPPESNMNVSNTRLAPVGRAHIWCIFKNPNIYCKQICFRRMYLTKHVLQSHVSLLLLSQRMREARRLAPGCRIHILYVWSGWTRGEPRVYPIGSPWVHPPGFGSPGVHPGFTPSKVVRRGHPWFTPGSPGWTRGVNQGWTETWRVYRVCRATKWPAQRAVGGAHLW